MYGIQKVDAMPFKRGGQATELSNHVHAVLAVIAGMPDGTYRIWQDEHGEAFDDIEQAQRFASSMRDAANRQQRHRRDVRLKVTRHRTEIYVTKEDKRQ